MKVFLYFVGKPRDPRLNGVAEDFVNRCARYVRMEMREIQPERFNPRDRHPAALRILMDPAGRTMNSAEFVRMIEQAEMQGRDVVFVVGGAEGLPEDWKLSGDMLLSLSPMTFPHELARAMLTEQIYRALTTLRGHPYPR